MGTPKMKTMVAIDEDSLYALEWTLQKLHGSLNNNNELLIFTVQPVTVYKYSPLAFLLAWCGATGVNKVVQNSRKIIAENLLEKAKHLCNQYGLTAETLTEVGDPKELICDTLEKSNVQLLVMGNRSNTPGGDDAKRVGLGSISHHCLEKATCPVLVVNKPV